MQGTLPLVTQNSLTLNIIPQVDLRFPKFVSEGAQDVIKRVRLNTLASHFDEPIPPHCAGLVMIVVWSVSAAQETAQSEAVSSRGPQTPLGPSQCRAAPTTQ